MTNYSTLPVVFIDVPSLKMVEDYTAPINKLLKDGHSFELALSDRTRTMLAKIYNKKEGTERGYFV